jgi:hypothetical protein
VKTIKIQDIVGIASKLNTKIIEKKIALLFYIFLNKKGGKTLKNKGKMK